MTQRAKTGLKLAAAAIFAALLVAITLNAAVDFWTPQVGLNEPAAPAKDAAAPSNDSLQMPLATRPAPASPLPEQQAATPPPPWNQPLFEPKFDGPGIARSNPQTGAQGFSAPDFSGALNQFAPFSQVLPPSVLAPGSDPAPVSIRPIFGGKSGGVESGALGAAGSLSGTAGSTVGGAVSGATSVLNKR